MCDETIANRQEGICPGGVCNGHPLLHNTDNETTDDVHQHNDDTGYWKNLDWDKAIATGMKDSGAPWSGKVDFIKTEMSWPITHMVAPKEKAVGCNECHTRGGRLDKIEGIYIPGRDAHQLLDLIGWLAAGGTLAGVMLHALVRIVRRKN